MYPSVINQSSDPSFWSFLVHTLTTVGVKLGLVFHPVLAQTETEPVQVVAEAEAELEAESEPETDPEQDPEVEPVFLKDGPEDVVGGTVAKPNSWPWQVETNQFALQQGEVNSEESNMRF